MARSPLVAPALAGLVGVGALAAGYGPPCPLHSTTGWWCPLCGGTRAARALLHGQVAKSLHDNVFAVPVGLVMVWALAAWIWPRWRIKVPTAAVWSAVVLLGAFAVIRNLSAFTALTPNA